MKVSGFDELADLALRKSGHAFKESQQYLLDARLSDILRRESFSELVELADCLKARPNPVLEDEVVSAMLSKETRFFQDRTTLSVIVSDILPAAAKRQEEVGENAALRVWCAGGGTGQEAYSLAMLVDEADPELFLGRDIEIISSDICKRSVERASAGAYNHYEIQLGLSAERMLKYFNKKDDAWVANSSLRERIACHVHNLLEPFDTYERFDVIVCRNVLSGILSPIATDIAKKIGSVLQDNGALVLGPGETLPAGIGFVL